MKKRILSVLLCFVMVLGMMPTVAFATDDGATTAPKAIMLGTGGISGPTSTTNSSGTYKTPSSYIYFGVNSTNNRASIKWRVLDANANVKIDESTTKNGMFLLSENLLDTGVKFNESNATTKNAWQGSNAQQWCTDFLVNTSNFSETENNAVLGITKTDSALTAFKNTNGDEDLTWGGSSLSGDKLFFLSAQELATYVANYTGADTLKASLQSGLTGDSMHGGCGLLIVRAI